MAVGTAQQGRALALEAERYLAVGRLDANTLRAYISQLEEYADTYVNLRPYFQGIITRLRAALDQLDQQKLTESAAPINSAGAQTKVAAEADDESSRTQNPPPSAQVVKDDGQIGPTPSGAETNATQPQLSDNTNLGVVDGTASVGGNVPVRTVNQTQSGTPSASDDAVENNTAPPGTASAVNSGAPPVAPEFLAPIVATPNRLQGLASMTYSASIYLMNVEEYTNLLISNKKVLPPNTQCIIQSGGINKAERNQYFDVDFYIDDIWIESLVGSQSGAKAHNATQMSFTITEPMGITFLNRLRLAVKEHSELTGVELNELSQNFLMVIRFYGYNDRGELIRSSDLGISEVASDPQAIVEKWIPFQITDLRYFIDKKAVTYQIKAICPTTGIPFSQMYATIPFNVEISSADVGTLFNGPVSYTNNANSAKNATGEQPDAAQQAPAPPPKAGAVSDRSVITGLAQALNKFEQELAAKNGYEIPNQFEIILEDVPGLKDARMARPGTQDKSRSPMNQSENAANKFLSSKSKYDKNTKTYSITAGTQIVQLIDLVMRTSSYITSQQNIIIDEETGEVKPQASAATVQWFRVRSRAVPLGYDSKKRDLSYKITYTISRYQINNPLSAYFPEAAYRGVHKIYNYWFTGQNTEVLDFKIDVNANFFLTIGNDGLEPNRASGRWFEKRAFQASPNESTQGGNLNSQVPAASLSERLYSFADIATNELTIIGDPDLLQQSTIFYNNDIDLKPFMKDGSVNYDASEVLYELRFNPPTDYDLTTGLVPVRDFNVAQSPVTKETNLPQESIVWAIAVVHNYFKAGRFTQKLMGMIRQFDDAQDQQARATIQEKQVQNEKNTDKAQQTNTKTAQNAVQTSQQPGSNSPKPSATGPLSTLAPNSLQRARARIASQSNLSQVPPKPGSTVVDDDAAQINPPL